MKMSPPGLDDNGWKQWSESVVREITNLRTDIRSGFADAKTDRQEIWEAIEEMRAYERSGAIERGKLTVKVGALATFFGILGGAIGTLMTLIARGLF